MNRTDTPVEHAAANDPRRSPAVDTDGLAPLPLFSRRSVRAVLTMDGTLGLVRHDDEGNVRLST
jgi:hypothetical protein